MVPANEPLLGLASPVPCGWDPNLLIKAGPPTPHASRVHPRNGGPLCRKSFEKSSAPHLLGLPPAASSVESPRRRRTCSLDIAFMVGLGISEKGERYPGKSTQTGALGSFF